MAFFTAPSQLGRRAGRRGGPPALCLARPRLWAFLASALCAALFILPFTLPGRGILYVSNDQITQQIPLAQQVVRLLHSGQWTYDFGMDLGTGVVEGYSWYNLGSVFSLLYLLLPAAATPYLVAPVLVVKFGAAGLFAFLFMRRHTHSDLAALAGSLLYSFSGIFITNLVFPFADVYALFPLLPWAMDGLWQGGRRGWFALAVALNALVNPPLFFGAAVFMVLYFGVQLLYGAYAAGLRRFLHLAGEAVCGVALAGALLLPFVHSLAANPRVGGMLPFGKDWFVYVAYRYFELLRGLVLPGEVMHQNALMLPHDAVSPEGYLPVFGLVLAFAFCLKKKGHWLRGLLAACLVCLCVPVLNSAFNAFNGTYYTRWLYMPVCMAALASALCLEDDTVPLRHGFWLWGALAAGLAGCMMLWRVHYGYADAVVHLPLLCIQLVVCAAGLGVTAGSRRLWRHAPHVVVALVAAFGVFTGAVNLFFNQQIAKADYGPLDSLAAQSIYAGDATPLPEGVYRIQAPVNVSNTYFGHGSPFSFNSTLPGGVFRLQAAFGRQRTSVSCIEYDEPGLWSLLGVEYLISPSADAAAIPLPNVSLVAEGQPYAVLRNADALPLVFGYDAVVPASAADGLDNTAKSIAMLHTLVVEDEALAAGPLAGLPRFAQNTAALAGLDYAQGVAARQAMAAETVQLGRGQLAASLTMPHSGALLITLPYSTGWRCTINGVPATVQQAHWGLCAVACPTGPLTLEMTYHPPGQTLGLGLSALGLLGLAGLFWAGWLRRRTAPDGSKKPGAVNAPGPASNATPSGQPATPVAAAPHTTKEDFS